MGAGNDIEIPTFSIDIEIQKDISIDIEISIYDPLTIAHLLKMSKCELPLKVLQMANFSQITHSPTFGRAFTW